MLKELKKNNVSFVVRKLQVGDFLWVARGNTGECHAGSLFLSHSVNMYVSVSTYLVISCQHICYILSTCLSVCQFICYSYFNMFVTLCQYVCYIVLTCLSVCQHVCHCVNMSVSVSTCMSVCQHIYYIVSVTM